jgi:hypothetical protein
MLAEIFIVRLEIRAAARELNEVTSANNVRFVPFTPMSQLTFKDGTVWGGRA